MNNIPSLSTYLPILSLLISCQPTEKWVEGQFLDYGNIDGEILDTSAAFNEEDQDHCNFIFLLEHGYVGATHRSHLWKFKPSQGKLIDVGDINCPFSFGNDYLIAMTADQDGILWFVSNSERLYWLNPNNMECNDAGILAQQESINLRSRSLAFMREDSSSEDILFLGSYYGWSTPEQAVLTKVTDNQIELIGEVEGFTGYAGSLELAGTSTGRMFGQSFGLGENSRFIEMNPNSAEVLVEWALPIETGSGFTFAFWNNEVWFFPSTGTNGNAEVYRFDPLTENFEFNMELPYKMVGAAAPTCADAGSGS